MRIKESFASLKLRRASASHASSGVAFIGSPLDSFHMIIRCPIHVYTCIRKAIHLFENPPQMTFCSGSIPITDLAASKFIGTFRYVSPIGKKQRFHAAFICPTCCGSDDFRAAFQLYNALSYAGYEYYSKENKSLKTLLTEVDFGHALFTDSIFQDFVRAIDGVAPDEIK